MQAFTSCLLVLSSDFPAGTFLFPNFFLTLMSFKIKQTNTPKKKKQVKKKAPKIPHLKKKKPTYLYSESGIFPNKFVSIWYLKKDKI